MLEFLPDMSGQPPWVVIVVAVLLVAGTVGSRLIGRGRGGTEAEGEAEGDRPALPPGQHRAADDTSTTTVLTKALDLLAREAVESQEARDENNSLRRQLLECGSERDRIAARLTAMQAELEQCDERCRRLARRAMELGGGSGD